MKQLLSMCLFAIGTIGMTQTSGTLKGKVFDEFGEPLIGARISVEVGGSEIKTGANLDGEFSIKPLNSGSYIVKVNSIGYAQKQYNIIIKSDQITFLNNISLDPGTVGLMSPIHITEKLINPEETSLISLSAKKIKNSPNLRNIGALVTSMSSDIKSSEDGELYFRGSRSDGIVQFIDGVKSTGSLNGLPGRAIGRVSVYTGGIPAKYGDTTSGVVVLETKSYFDLYYARMAGNE